MTQPFDPAAAPPPRPPWEPVPGTPPGAEWQGSALLVRLQLSATELRLTGPRVRTRVPRDRVAYAILGLAHESSSGTPQRVLLLFDDRRQLICRLYGSIWGDEALFSLCRALALPAIDIISWPTTMAAISERHPGLLPDRVLRPATFAAFIPLVALLGLLVIAAIVAVAIL